MEFNHLFCKLYNSNKSPPLSRFFSIAITLFSVFILRGQINLELTQANWEIGKVHSVYGYRVLRLYGPNDGKEMTNLGYQNLSDISQELDENCNGMAMSAASKKKTQKIYNYYYTGGLLHFFITRNSMQDGDARNFEVIIKDSANQSILFKQRLTEDPANAPSFLSDAYWNYFTLPLPINLPKTFYVIIQDYANSRVRKFAFIVQTSL